MIVAVAVVACMCAAWFAYALHEKQAADKELAAAATEVTDLQRDQREFAETVRVQTDTALLTQQLTTVMASDLDWAALLATLRRAGTPSRIKLEGINGTLNSTDSTSTTTTSNALPRTDAVAAIGSLTVDRHRSRQEGRRRICRRAREAVRGHQSVRHERREGPGRRGDVQPQGGTAADLALRPVHRQVHIFRRQVMGARHADRLWIVAGMAVIALLGVATWFLAISPQRTEAAGLADQTATSHAQADELRARIVKLTADKAGLGELIKTLNAGKVALPADSGVPNFLRQLQATEPAVKVDIENVTIGEPTPEETVPGVWSVTMQLNAQGTVAKLGDFLKRLQSATQSRAVLIEAANLTSGGAATTGTAGDWTLSFTMKAFVAPPVGAGKPAITTD